MIYRILVACLLFFACLFFELLMLLSGISLLFDKINAFQIIFHGLGCIVSIWQILDRFQYKTVWSILGFFGVPPVLLEIVVLFAACSKYKVINEVEQI